MPSWWLSFTNPVVFGHQCFSETRRPPGLSGSGKGSWNGIPKASAENFLFL
jgi:hypothetical protein